MKHIAIQTTLAICVGVVASGFVFDAKANAADRPNIVLIMVDDMGWSNIGCYGGMVETPNIDSLAAGGVRFNQFYNAARCCPTRATLMSGLHPHQVGIGHMSLPRRPLSVSDSKNSQSKSDPKNPRSIWPLKTGDRADVPASYQGWLDLAIPSLPEMLKSAGYGTYMTGKWHLASEDQSTWPLQRGFDRFYGHLAGTSDYFAPADLHRGNEPITAKGERYYITDAISDEAVKYLSEHENRKDTEPFFLYLAYNAPHFPMHCMPEDYKKYRGRFKAGWDVLREKRLAHQIEMGIVPGNTKLAPRPKSVPAWDSLTPQKQDEMDAIMSTYAGMIDRVDQNIGKLTKHLKETGELDNTIVFFLSDNGAEAESGPLGRFKFNDLGQYGKGGSKYGKAWATLSNTPLREYKHFTHQGGVQSPLVVHWPAGIDTKLNNQVLSQHGYLPDLVETCLDLAGAKRPLEKNGKPVPSGDGVSFAKLLRGDLSELHSEPICIEHEGNRLVRDGKWKLVSYASKPWELYDLANDFSESDNVADQHPKITQRLKASYSQWAKRAGVADWETARKWSVYRKQEKKDAK